MQLKLASGRSLETFVAGDGDLVLCAAHPSDPFTSGTAVLLADTAKARAYVVNPPGLGGSSASFGGGFSEMVEVLEAAREKLGLRRWAFWGMSGGGWLAQLYAHRHPASLSAIIVEACCACFRERLRSPDCVLSPYFPRWRPLLEKAGAFDPKAHDEGALADGAEWSTLEGVGEVWRRKNGGVLLVSPAPVSATMKRAMPMLWTFDSRRWLGELKVPALVIAGSADPIAPVAQVKAVHEALPDARWLQVDGASHVPTAERRPEVATAVRAFLSAATGSAS